MVASKPIFSCNYLKLYSWLGYFPCMKINDGEQSKLIPISWKLQLLLYFFSSIIPVGSFFAFRTYEMLSNELHMIELVAMMRGIDKKDKELDMGTILYLFVTLSLFLLHTILHFKNWQMKEQICDLQSIFNQHLGTCVKKYSKRATGISL